MAIRLILVVLTFALPASHVHGGVVLSLAADAPGPYFGGERLNVDVWLEHGEESDLLLILMRLDFSASDSDLDLDSSFEFDSEGLGKVFQGYHVEPLLPIPMAFNTILLVYPGNRVLLPHSDSLHLGSIGVVLPTSAGAYVLDALNSDAVDGGVGAMVVAYGLEGLPVFIWEATNGEIDGGALRLTVVPEPSTSVLALLGCVACLARRRRARRISDSSG